MTAKYVSEVTRRELDEACERFEVRAIEISDGRAMYRCRLCGQKGARTPFLPDRWRHRCSGPRGFGDYVEAGLKWIGVGKKGCRPCAERQRKLNRWSRERFPRWFGGERRRQRVLFTFPHGLGDTVQMTVLIKHLKKHFPRWSIDVAVKPGCPSIFHGLCDAYVGGGQGEYDRTEFIPWYEPYDSYANSPSTKAEKCLREMFGIEPEPELCTYTLNYTSDARDRAAKYLSEITGHHRAPYPVLLMHYQGTTSPEYKSLSEHAARRIVRIARERGLVPVILDWERPHRSRLIESDGVECPHVDHELWAGLGTGDAGTIAALADQSALCFGIDSGPGKIMAATSTPTVIYWKGLHPIHYAGLDRGNVVHLVPRRHDELIRGDRSAGETYFRSNYNHRVYEHWRTGVPEAVRQALDDWEGLKSAIDHRIYAPAGCIERHGLAVRAEHYAADMTIIDDVYRDDCYRVDSWDAPRFVVDVGAHIGSFAKKVHDAHPHARIACIEPNPDNTEVLQHNVGRFVEIAREAIAYETAQLVSTVYPGTDNTGGSWLTKDPPAGSRIHRVEHVSLAAIVDRVGFPWIDVLKLDCEGCELGLLEKEAHFVGERVNRIVMEVHSPKALQPIWQAHYRDWTVRSLRAGAMPLVEWVNVRQRPRPNRNQIATGRISVRPK